MNEDTGKLTEARKRCGELRGRAKSLIMATVGVNTQPRASYAPFVYNSAAFHVYLSRLSEHTQELITNPVVSILLIADEADTTQIFARMRLSYLCEAETIDRGEPGYDPTLNHFKRRFGNVMDLLQSLPDFVLFRLTPISGRFVSGFGQAYDLVGNQLDDLLAVGPDQV
jgi:putative heme iron utilization protein